MIRNSCVGILLCLFLTLVMLPAAAGAADAVPIKVTSEKLSYDAGGQQVRFEGNVHVTHPDAQLWAERIVIHLANRKGGSKPTPEAADPRMDPGQIDRIVAQGGVKVEVRDGKTGTCDKATYTLATGVLTMEGSPVLRDGTNSIQGAIINFYVKENKSEVLGSSDAPVEALFTAPKKLKQ